jgi:hypothetical protein
MANYYVLSGAGVIECDDLNTANTLALSTALETGKVSSVLTERSYQAFLLRQVNKAAIKGAGTKAANSVKVLVAEGAELSSLPQAIALCKANGYHKYDVILKAESGLSLSAKQVQWIMSTAARVAASRRAVARLDKALQTA